MDAGFSDRMLRRGPDNGSAWMSRRLLVRVRAPTLLQGFLLGCGRRGGNRWAFRRARARLNVRANVNLSDAGAAGAAQGVA